MNLSPGALVFGTRYRHYPSEQFMATSAWLPHEAGQPNGFARMAGALAIHSPGSSNDKGGNGRKERGGVVVVKPPSGQNANR